ncbi:DUF2793 domain-containing protein [Sphingomonas sp. 28-63-12]|uniref:DUF2793 domain-containing protein n=1 Tax=Sphingomonas sp. 28-63-12 TaxID=1970434 RepID=UPI000BD1FC2F|nr:MAG: hypothetical protein B7Y47_11070 [Sphingomonas sp. 28-63-12]
MRDDLTPRLALPLLQPGQAQKELYHNEALVLIDLAIQASVNRVGENTPPEAPTAGASWIVGSAPTGAWVGAASHLASWTAGGWRFVAPFDGMTAWSLEHTAQARFAAGIWTIGEARCASVMIDGVQVVGPRRPAIAPPAGGAVIDSEARLSIEAMLAALIAHGLIAG